MSFSVTNTWLCSHSSTTASSPGLSCRLYTQQPQPPQEQLPPGSHQYQDSHHSTLTERQDLDMAAQRQAVAEHRHQLFLEATQREDDKASCTGTDHRFFLMLILNEVDRFHARYFHGRRVPRMTMKRLQKHLSSEMALAEYEDRYQDCLDFFCSQNLFRPELSENNIHCGPSAPIPLSG